MQYSGFCWRTRKSGSLFKILHAPLPVRCFLQQSTSSLSRQFIRGEFFVGTSIICGDIPDYCAQTLDVAGNHGEGNISFEAINSVVPAQIQTVNTKCVDCWFNAWMLLPCIRKFRCRFPFFIGIQCSVRNTLLPPPYKQQTDRDEKKGATDHFCNPLKLWWRLWKIRWRRCLRRYRWRRDSSIMGMGAVAFIPFFSGIITQSTAKWFLLQYTWHYVIFN